MKRTQAICTKCDKPARVNSLTFGSGPTGHGGTTISESACCHAPVRYVEATAPASDTGSELTPEQYALKEQEVIDYYGRSLYSRSDTGSEEKG